MIIFKSMKMTKIKIIMRQKFEKILYIYLVNKVYLWYINTEDKSRRNNIGKNSNRGEN